MSHPTRGEFVRVLGRAAAVVGLAPLLGCGGDPAPSIDARPPTDAPPDARGMCLANGTGVVIATNHGHALTVSIADVTAQAPRTYDIMGEATHSHTVTLSAADFATLAGNDPVTVTSSSLGHTHQVTVYCV